MISWVVPVVMIRSISRMVLAQPLQGRRQDVGERGRTGPKMNAPDVTFRRPHMSASAPVGLGADPALAAINPRPPRCACLADAAIRRSPTRRSQVADAQADREARSREPARWLRGVEKRAGP